MSGARAGTCGVGDAAFQVPGIEAGIRLVVDTFPDCLSIAVRFATRHATRPKISRYHRTISRGFYIEIPPQPEPFLGRPAARFDSLRAVPAGTVPFIQYAAQSPKL